MDEKDKLRLDKYLWCIRIFKTRSMATDACNSGQVSCAGVRSKPSRIVRTGEQYEIRTAEKKWLIEVVALLGHRVQYAEAVQYYLDLSLPVEKPVVQPSAFVFHTGKRPSKQGRPTKKDRRDLQGFVE